MKNTAAKPMMKPIKYVILFAFLDVKIGLSEPLKYWVVRWEMLLQIFKVAFSLVMVV